MLSILHEELDISCINYMSYLTRTRLLNVSNQYYIFIYTPNQTP